MIDMNIRIYGTDERLSFCRDYLSKKNIRSTGEIVLLPIPTTRDGKTIFGVGKTPDEILCEVMPGAVVVGYEIPKAFKECFSKAGLYTVDVCLDEDFTADNAMLTALGTVGKILTEERAAPKELSIGIIGYGRIGKRLLNILLFLGAKMTLFTSKESVIYELGSLGVSALPYDVLSGEKDCSALPKLDIIINTAPAKIISTGVALGLNETKFIELASGNNFPKDTEVIRLPALPAKTYPKSAGKVLADSVFRMLGEKT